MEIEMLVAIYREAQRRANAWPAEKARAAYEASRWRGSGARSAISVEFAAVCREHGVEPPCSGESISRLMLPNTETASRDYSLTRLAGVAQSWEDWDAQGRPGLRD